MTALASHEDTLKAYSTAHQSTHAKYKFIYSSKLDTVISLLIARGTQFILKDEEDKRRIARLYASIACYFENFMEGLNKTRDAPNLAKILELLGADDHTLVSYYRKRIPCACLDEKYKEVKSVKKMGRCYNLSCSHPHGRVERSKMFSCTRCGMVNYCSVECQKAAWKDHKQNCGKTAELRASFNSSSHMF